MLWLVGWYVLVWIVYSRQGSVEILQVTGSLLLQIRMCCLIVVYILVHHYLVFGDYVSHASLRRYFMIELLYFTNRACAEARCAAKHSRNLGAGYGSSPDHPARSPCGTMHRTRVDDPPARKAARAVTSAMQDVSSPVGTSTAVSVTQCSAPLAPVMCPFPSGGCRCRYRVSPFNMSHRISQSQYRL